MRVVFQYALGPLVRDALHRFRQEDIEVIGGPVDGPVFLAQLPEAEVIWHVLSPITAQTIAAAPRLRLIQKIGVGVNTIDLEAARARGIAVCNMPGTNSRAVAEMALLLMLAVLRRLAKFDAMTRAGRGWSRTPEEDSGLRELAGRTVGLVGYGAVPRVLAPILRALDVTIVYASRSGKPEAVGDRVPLDELLRRSDVVSLHLPLTDETRNLIDARALARMKPGAILINTARGGLVDEGALHEAIAAGRLGGAGLDVFSEEPLASGNPLLALDGVVVAPHVAWLTDETLLRSLEVAAENCRRLRAGSALLNRVV